MKYLEISPLYAGFGTPSPTRAQHRADFFMTLTQLYKHTAKNAPFIANMKRAEFTAKLRILREEYPKANEIRKPEIKREADEIKKYLEILA